MGTRDASHLSRITALDAVVALELYFPPSMPDEACFSVEWTSLDCDCRPWSLCVDESLPGKP